jgi:hypothetical protein
MRVPSSGASVQAKVKLGPGKYEWRDGTFRSVTPKGRYMVNVLLPDGTHKVLTFAAQQVRRIA